MFTTTLLKVFFSLFSVAEIDYEHRAGTSFQFISECDHMELNSFKYISESNFLYNISSLNTHNV